MRRYFCMTKKCNVPKANMKTLMTVEAAAEEKRDPDVVGYQKDANVCPRGLLTRTGLETLFAGVEPPGEPAPKDDPLDTEEPVEDEGGSLPPNEVLDRFKALSPHFYPEYQERIVNALAKV